jgi:prepilin-type N-terminal cleavage/methylation domain-containing protein
MRVPVLKNERGVTLIELCAALVVLAIGVLALVRIFPTATRSQSQDRMLTLANLYAQERIEDLGPKTFTDSALDFGRHPATSASDEALGSGAWHRYYTVTAMAAPLDNLKKVTVTVYWTNQGARTVTATTYMRR